SMLEVVISHDRFTQLQLKEGETLVVRPKRLRVFVDVGTPAMPSTTPAREAV
ncbi:MAG: TOBE-like domain-containing protein, partial [Herminiimonas sp.]|nr:TOBE-like domain-containing protein [Herminiimonas sp.]